MPSMFLCVFKRRIWMENLEVIDKNKVSELNPFSNLQNIQYNRLFGLEVLKIKRHISYQIQFPLIFTVREIVIGVIITHLLKAW